MSVPLTPISEHQVAHLLDKTLCEEPEETIIEDSLLFRDGPPYDTDSELEDVLGLKTES